MKRLFLTTVCLYAFVMAWTAPVSLQQARQKAVVAMKQLGWTIDDADISTARPNKAPAQNSVMPYYVFNAGNSKGFVVISGDDNAETLLGYCDHGNFDEETMPDPMRQWLAGIEAEMKWLQENNVDGVTPAQEGILRAPKPAIEPMIQTKWDQGAPYWNLCPKYNNKSCFTGCVATAMAQVMYYYKWPEESLPLPAYTTWTHKIEVEALPALTFSWDDMHHRYYSDRPDGTAVAELMRYAGQSIQMDYAPDGSGANNEMVVNALKNYFNYDQNIRLVHRAGYTIAEWEDLIYEELANNRPVLYSGSSMDAGHEFVCDGYDGNGLFSINWGWSGNCDGHFKLSVLNPNSTAGAGAGETPDGFPNFQQAVIGVQPPTGEPPVTQPVLPNLSRLYNSDNSMTAQFYNSHRRSIVVSLALALEDENGDWQVINEAKYTMQARSSKSISCLTNTVITTPGTYKVVPLIKEDGDDATWRKAGRYYDYIDLNAEDNNGTLAYSYVVHPIFDIEITEIEPEGRVNVGMNKMNVTVLNRGDEYNGMLYVYCGPNPTAPNGYVTVALEGDSETRMSIFFNVSTLDEFNISIWAEHGEYIQQVGFRDFEYYDLDVESYEITFDPLVAKVVIHNFSDYDYTDEVRMLLLDSKKKQKGKLDKVQVVPGHDSAEFIYDTITLPAEGVYYMRFQYHKSEVNPGFVTITPDVKIDYQVVAIREISAGQNSSNGQWITMTGQQVSKPSQHGIYIRNGRKVVK